MESFCKVANQQGPNFILPDLPYQKTDLGEYYTKELLDLHHGKHHAAYVNNLNNLIQETNFVDMDLEQIMIKTCDDVNNKAIFNNAAQIWNHSFFWHCMKKAGGKMPSGSLLKQINDDFGSYDEFLENFKNKAAKLFGSGWCWLVLNKEKKLEIIQTSNAENPLTTKKVPLLALDVWEHAYYPVYQNRRPEFIEKFFSDLVNWDFVGSIYNNKK